MHASGHRQRAGPRSADRSSPPAERATYLVQPIVTGVVAARERCRVFLGPASGEGGIRTRDGVLSPYSLSRRVPSATRPPLLGSLWRQSRRCSRAVGPIRAASIGPRSPRRGGRAVECASLENWSPANP